MDNATTPPPTLDDAQRRVLGVLIEKAKTTPAGYPMSVNAIVTACNQKQNRDPLTSYGEDDVLDTLRSLERLRLVSEIDWMGRVSKYKHHVYERLGVNKVEAAVLAELLLRGAQSVGELRARAARMEPIADLEALRPVLEAMAARGLVAELTPAGRGQVVTDGLRPAAELDADRARARSGVASPAASEPEAAGTPHGWSEVVAGLRQEIASLRARVEALEAGRRHEG